VIRAGWKNRIRLLFRGRRRVDQAAVSSVSDTAARAARGRGSRPPEVPIMRAFNLLPARVVRTRTRRVQPAHVALVAATAALLALLAGAFLFERARLADTREEYRELPEEAARETPRQQPPRRPTDPLAESRSARTGALAAALGSRVAWDRLLRDLSLVLPDNVWFQSVTAAGPTGEAPASDPEAAGEGGDQAPAAEAPASESSPSAAPTSEAVEPNSVAIRGYTYEHDHVARLLARLSVLPQLSSVRLLSSTRTRLGGEDVVEFSLVATLARGGGGA
jgi:Tfp pilus assembly protein PilN